MSCLVRKFFMPGLAALAALAIGTSTTRAVYTITVSEDGGAPIPIVDGGPLDQDGLVNGSITAITPALNSTLTNFTFSSLGGTSSLLSGTPGSNDLASVSQSGEVARTATGGSHTLTIVASDTGFLFPTGDPKFMTTAAADTFRNTTAGDSRTFQSTFDATGSGGGLVNSPLFAFVPPNGPGPFGTSNPGTLTALGAQPTPFDLSNTTVITLGPNPTTGAQSDQFNGATTVSAVPEPASLALMLLGLPALALGRRLRRSNAA
jgi:hypothetical protein